MTFLIVLCLVSILLAIPFGIKKSLAYKKECIEKKAARLGYDLRFDQ